jgi:tight adherence protein B
MLADGIARYGMVVWTAGWLGCAVVWVLPSAAELRLRALTTARAPRPSLRALAAVVRRRLTHRPGLLARRRLRGCADVCRAIAAELRCGSSPGKALAAALRGADPLIAAELAEAAVLAEAGHDPVPALRAASRRPGGTAWASLAVCWQVAASSGTGVAAVVERLADALAHQDALHRELDIHLAGPRTTAVLLAGLPIAGLLMASALGGAPLLLLFTTPLGWGCLCAGIALNAAGVWWTRRLVHRVLRTAGM